MVGCKLSSRSDPFESKNISDNHPSSPLTFETILEQHDREFNVVKVDLRSKKVKLQLYQFLNPKQGITNVYQLAKSEGLAVAVNASFFEVRGGLFLPMGPTVVDGKELPSYLDSEIEKEKYGVFYCTIKGECNISTLFEYNDLFSSQGKLPNLVASGMSWSIKSGVVHPKGSGIQTGRTVIGLSKDRKTLYLVQGFGTYLSIANATQKAGAYNAFNFDGGGSSQLVFRDQRFPEFPKKYSNDLENMTPNSFFESQRQIPIILGVSELP
jgi:hypothetical protein